MGSHSVFVRQHLLLAFDRFLLKQSWQKGSALKVANLHKFGTNAA